MFTVFILPFCFVHSVKKQDSALKARRALLHFSFTFCNQPCLRLHAVEDLLTLADDDALALKTFTRKALIDGGDLHIIDRHTALLDQTARLTAGRAQAGRDQHRKDIDVAVFKVGIRQRARRHVGVIAARAEERLGRLLRLLGLLFPVDECGKLVGEDLLRAVELAALPLIHLIDLLERQECEHTDALQNILIAQVTDEEQIRDLVNNGKATFYIGFDCTADSLHVGHFMALCLMKRLQMAGNKPIALIGGGTTMIGDPSGRNDMRKMLTKADIDHNAECFKRQMERFIDFGEGKAMMLNNADWLMKLNYIELLREVGACFSVNNMLRAKCYEQRMEKGLSFLEFNYMIMQSYDFYHMFQEYGCNMQFGGDDQWSNMLGGTELIRRKLGKDAQAMTITLLLNSEGKKMGKTASGAVWLDPNKTMEVKRLLHPIAAFEIPEVFDVSLGSTNRRECDIKHCKARILCMCQEVFQHLKVYVRVADDALFPHLFASRLKLGLDEAGDMSALF